MEKKENRKSYPLMVIFFMTYIVLLFYLLFFSESYGRTTDSGYRYNFELFKEIKRFWYNRDTLGWSSVVNLFGNIVAFAPFGFFLPMLCRIGKNVFGCVALSAVFSFCVESVQLYTKVGAFDVDDIFLNSVGGLVGYLVFYLVWRPMARRIQK